MQLAVFLAIFLLVAHPALWWTFHREVGCTGFVWAIIALFPITYILIYGIIVPYFHLSDLRIFYGLVVLNLGIFGSVYLKSLESTS